MYSYKKLFLTTALFSVMAVPAYATNHSDDVSSLITEGKFFGELRYRYEGVEQDGIDNDADAHTIRANLGFKTGTYNGFQALIEGQFVQGLGSEDYNNTVNGNAGVYPVVADPDVTELNELWVAWSGLPDTTVKVGRQKINIDNQRFVGTVGWRQNDQTFDALSVTTSPFDGFKAQYAYVQNVNRIFGDDANLGDLKSSVHIANASYKVADWLKLTGYGYFLEFDRLAGSSSQTYGLRATGKVPLSEDWTFFYEAEAATQDDYQNNTANYDEDYFHIAPGIKGHGLAVKVGYEELGGDGTNSFQTPLATLHKFNGWADVFLTTPASGLEDFYVSGSYKVSGTDSILDGTKFTAVYHDFASHEGSEADFGDELNLAVGKTFTLPDAGQPFKKVGVTLKYADFDSDNASYASREKIWLQLGVKF